MKAHPVVATLASLVSINSVNASYEGGAGEGEIARWVRQFFAVFRAFRGQMII